MKKILLGICSLAFVSCLTAGVALNAPVEVANAETSIFTETKVQVSNEGNKMLVVTGITDVDVVYELGYKVNGQTYVAGAGETAETTKYYESLTLGNVTKTASEFIAGAEGLLIWEIAYDNTKSYSVQPYALVGELQGGVLIAPEVEVPTFGTAKENFNVFTVTFVDEDGEEIDTVEVNYGATVSAIEAPVAKDWYEFDGWYLNGEKYDFEQPIEKDIELTAKYVESNTMVYSVANNNLIDIANGINDETVAVRNQTFANTNENINVTMQGAHVQYNGDSVNALHMAGVVFDFGKDIIVSEYESIKILFQTIAAGKGTNIFLGSSEVSTQYGGAHIVDLKVAANGKGVTSFRTLELSLVSYAAVTTADFYIAYIEFVLADKVEEPEEPEVPVGPQSVTYSVANGNINDIVSSINGDGTYGTIGYNFNDGNGGVVALTYTIQNFTSGNRTIGIVFDLGEINISDYSSIKITYQAMATSGNAIVYLDDVEVSNPYGGIHILDLKDLATQKGVKSFSKIELSLHSWSTATEFKIYVASIELVVA